MIFLMFPTGYASSGEEYIAKGKALHAKITAEDKDGRVTLSWAPHAPYTVMDEQWLELKKLADDMGCTIHTHLHETAAEVECSCKLDTTSPQGMVRTILYYTILYCTILYYQMVSIGQKMHAGKSNAGH
jgi:5-methylthioadenosine/S-adenosylhomocysteine deaminase|eukprot:COSAG06_NODE_2113_length_7561_cov_2.657196_3_plen_129_part_00